MARPKRAPQRHVEPEDESQDIEGLEATEPDEETADEPDADAGRPKMSKVDAVRAALAEGVDSPEALACVFSPDGRHIAYTCRVTDGGGTFAQVFVVGVTAP